MKILGLCASLRSKSSNAYILKALKDELNEHHWFDFELKNLPFFDPDNQYSENIPEIVLEIRALAKNADCLFIATPEYAHGIPGILKNALEWIFHEGTGKKPVFVIIGSAEGENTKSQLLEVLTTMDFFIKEENILLIKSARSKFDSEGKFKDEKQLLQIKNFANHLLTQMAH